MSVDAGIDDEVARLRRELERLRAENHRLSRLLDLRGQDTAPPPEQLAAIAAPGPVTMASEASAYRPLWSADVFAELRRNLMDRGLTLDRVDRRLGQMSRSFPDALVTGYESLIDGMTNHPKDRHVHRRCRD